MSVDLRLHSVYLLASLDPLCAGLFYVGYTTDPLRRLRQHNGELNNGAHRTSRKGRPWCLVSVVSGFGEDRAALRFEWLWQMPSKSKDLRETAQRLKQARISGRTLPYAIAILHKLLQIEPFVSTRLTLYVLRKDLFFPLSVAVSAAVPPPKMIADALAQNAALAGSMATRVAQQQGNNRANNSANAALAATANATAAQLHTLECGEDSEQKLAAFLSTSINSPMMSQMQMQQRGGAAGMQQQADMLSDVDSSDTDTAEATRQLEEVGCIGCTLCGKSAPSIFCLIRCPGNFVDKKQRRQQQQQQQHERNNNRDDDQDDDEDDPFALKDESEDAEIHHMPSCTMQCHVACLAVWFQCCHEQQQQHQNSSASRPESTNKKPQQQSLPNNTKSSSLEEVNLDTFGLDGLAQQQGQQGSQQNQQQQPLNKTPIQVEPFDCPETIKLPPTNPAPCPICGVVLHWPLLVAQLKDRLRRYKIRLETRRRIALEMRRVGLKVQARETTARGRKRNQQDREAEQSTTTTTTTRKPRGKKAAAAAAAVQLNNNSRNNNNNELPPMPNASFIFADKKQGDDDPFSPSSIASPFGGGAATTTNAVRQQNHQMTTSNISTSSFPVRRDRFEDNNNNGNAEALLGTLLSQTSKSSQNQQQSSQQQSSQQQQQNKPKRTLFFDTAQGKASQLRLSQEQREQQQQAQQAQPQQQPQLSAAAARVQKIFSSHLDGAAEFEDLLKF